MEDQIEVDSKTIRKLQRRKACKKDMKSKVKTKQKNILSGNKNCLSTGCIIIHAVVYG